MAEMGPAGYGLIAYGGNAEDVVLMRAFADRQDGFFVDVGAGEPVSGSLTKNIDRLGERERHQKGSSSVVGKTQGEPDAAGCAESSASTSAVSAVGSTRMLRTASRS